MAYIVYRPLKAGNERIEFVTDSVEKAKIFATKLRDEFLAKGWESWAKRVSVKRPNSTAAHQVANQLIEKGNSIDMFNQGGTYRNDGQTIALLSMDTYYAWAGLLRKTA